MSAGGRSVLCCDGTWTEKWSPWVNAPFTCFAAIRFVGLEDMARVRAAASHTFGWVSIDGSDYCADHSRVHDRDLDTIDKVRGNKIKKSFAYLDLEIWAAKNPIEEK